MPYLLPLSRLTNPKICQKWINKTVSRDNLAIHTESNVDCVKLEPKFARHNQKISKYSIDWYMT